MVQLNVAVPAELRKAVQIKALSEDRDVTAVVRELLTRWASSGVVWSGRGGLRQGPGFVVTWITVLRVPGEGHHLHPAAAGWGEAHQSGHHWRVL